MLIQRLVLKTYNAILKRIHSTLLPTVLILLYFSAYGLNNPHVIEIISRSTLYTIHIFAGLLMLLLGIILIYDLIINPLIRQNKHMVVDGSFIRYRNLFQSKSYRKLIDIIFYLFLAAIGILGFLLYLRRFYSEYTLFQNHLILRIVHIKLGLLAMSVIILRYYLTLTTWYDRLMHYLKTH
jgi:hypothetical protein